MFAAIFKNSAYANVFWILIGTALATAQIAQASTQTATEGILEETV